MPRPSSWSAASFFLLSAAAALPAGAATVLEKSVTIEVRGEGTVVESTRLAVRLDAAADLAAWSPYPVYLDEHRKLLALGASAKRPDGTVVKVDRKGLDTAEVAGEGVLHSSTKLRTVTFPAVPPGSVLNLDYQVEERSYFPSGRLPLAEGTAAVERLRVEVKGAGAGWRYRLDGPRDGLVVTESAGGVVVTGAFPAVPEPPDLAPAEPGPVLRYAWGPRAGWGEVGRWYEGLLAQVPRASAAVRAEAARLVSGIPGRRERVEALVAFVRRDVRYVAVEVGIGGYRPASPEEVLARRWGDCKDKAVLLVDLLNAAGIEAWPALVKLASDGRVDPEFPSPDEFNHAIAAVAADGLALAEDDPVAGGYLFLDATQAEGALEWLAPPTQDQEALVVRGDKSALVHTPLRPRREVEALQVEAALTPEGDARGQARLQLTGWLGSSLAARFAASRPDEVERTLREMLGRMVPGAAFADLHWTVTKAGLPAVAVSAKIELPALSPGSGPERSFPLSALTGAPAPGLLDDRKLAVVLLPGVQRTTWRLRLPAGWCPPSAQDAALENDLGSFRQTVALKDGVLAVERATELKRRWIEPAAFPALKELALAEHRAAKRRIRLACGGGPEPVH